MFGFISAKRKKEEEMRLEKERAEEARMQEEKAKEKEFERKVHIKRTLSTMKTNIRQLDDLKNSYIQKARDAQANNNKNSLLRAKQALKFCLKRQKYLEDMVDTFEFNLQAADMNRIIANFAESMKMMAEDMKSVVNINEIAEAQKIFEQAVEKNNLEYQVLDEYIESAQNSMEEAFNNSSINITDDEINRLIAGDEEVLKDFDFDDRINKIKEKMEN